MKKRIICVSSILTFVFSTQVFANEFKDIENSDAKEEIKYFNEVGYFETLFEESSEMFYPNKVVTRGEFVALFEEVLELESSSLGGTTNLPFVDTENLSEEQMDIVNTAYHNGIISGKVVGGELCFGYNDEITKEEMCTIIGRYLDLTASEDLLFNDSDDVSKWAKQYVSYFYNNQIIELDQNGEFNPKDSVSREEVVEILFKVDKYLNTAIDNGLKVENYIGNGKIGFKNGTYDESTFTMISDIDLIGNHEILITDSYANQLRIAHDNEVETVVGIQEVYDFAGLPIGGYVDGEVDNAVLNKPNKTLVYDDNLIIFTEEDSNVIRGYDVKEKKVFTIAGDIESGYKNGSNADAMFNKPTGIARDSQGNIYIADTLNNVIRKIDTKYNVTLYAGSPESYGNVVGDLKTAKFNEPTDLFIVDDVLYICDSGNNMIKKIENNNVEIVGGVDTYINEETQTQVGGDRDGDISVAQFNYPTGLYVVDDVVYVADSENNKIKTIKNGVVTTIAGSGNSGNQLGDALQSTFDYPSAVIVNDGKVYVADKNNHTVKVITQK